MLTTMRGRLTAGVWFVSILWVGSVLAAAPLPVRATPPPPTPAAPDDLARADAAFTELWNRTDLPVAQGLVVRPWIWGPAPLATRYEPRDESPGGQHLVRYYDHGRMELDGSLNDPGVPLSVGGGLLVAELATARVQVGDRVTVAAPLATLPVAGDPDPRGGTPTYAALARVGSFAGHRRAPDRTGRPVVEQLLAGGDVQVLTTPPEARTIATYEPVIGHNLPDVFWEFLNAEGPIYAQGQLVKGRVLDWVPLLGYPLTEPYWITVRAQGQERMVLMQAFQRRVLTYWPGKPPGLQVELSNTGSDYYHWRYDPPAPPPPDTPGAAPRPVPAIVLAALALLAALLGSAVLLRTPVLRATVHTRSGGATATLRITGTDFPPGAAVTVTLETTPDAPPASPLTARASESGGIAVEVGWPASQADESPGVVATALNGAVTARVPPRRGGPA